PSPVPPCLPLPASLPIARVYVYPPLHVIGRIVTRKAGVDMPPGISGIVCGRKTNGKCPQAVARQPTAFPYQAIERLVQHRRIDSISKAGVGILAEPYYRFRPR